MFKAWSSADHVKNWFSPETYTVPDAKVQMHPGGPFEVCMRPPTGEDHWTRGTHTRLVIDTHAADKAGKPRSLKFRRCSAPTRKSILLMRSVELVWTCCKPTHLSIHPWQRLWSRARQVKEVVRMQGGVETGVRSVVHATFHLARTYDAPIARVWNALTDEAAKQKWFCGTPGQWELLERYTDVRIGGKERAKGRWEGGVVSTFDAIYHDVIPNERLVYSYEMHLDEKKISVSLATMQLTSEGGKTTLKVTEQGAFLDGYDDAGSREHGTGQLLDALGASLKD